MENTELAQTNNNKLAQKSQSDPRIYVQNFINKLNKKNPVNGLEKTSDGKAVTLVISHVEMTLDEMFLGLWSTENFKWSVIQNEVVGSLDLVVCHPVNGMMIRRTGAACIQIMVDAVPDEFKYVQGDSTDVKALKAKQRNQWALDVSNKKSGALDLGFPKLKAECLKNAAQSLGKIFGRDLNRKNTDEFTPVIKVESGKSNLEKMQANGSV